MITRLLPKFKLFTVKLIRYFSIWNSTISRQTHEVYSLRLLIPNLDHVHIFLGGSL